MKKILFGLVGLLTSGAVIVGTAYALFTAQATVNGINFSTGSASIGVSKTNSSFGPTLNAGLTLANIFPGFGMDDSQQAPFWIINNSPEPMTMTAVLTSASGWGNGLEGYVKMAVNTADNSAGTGYHTLSEWNASGFTLPGPVAAATSQEYKIYVQLPYEAPNSVAGQSLTNITFTITGTQVTP